MVVQDIQASLKKIVNVTHVGMRTSVVLRTFFFVLVSSVFIL
jgi:hypothetical protein